MTDERPIKMLAANEECIECPPDITRDDFRRKFVALTPAQIADIEKHPQGSPGWLRVRQFRLTASNFGAIARHNKYCSQREVLKRMLWSGSGFSNEAMRRGTALEPVACAAYTKFRIAQRGGDQTATKVRHMNLCIMPSDCELGGSPDGVVEEDGIQFLLEIKVPSKSEFYNPIPVYYYDQITGMMAVLGLPWCDFVTYTDHYTRVQRYMFNKQYWEKFLKPVLLEFYYSQYMPRVILQMNGRLNEGEIDEILHIPRIVSMTTKKKAIVAGDSSSSGEEEPQPPPRKRKAPPATRKAPMFNFG